MLSKVPADLPPGPPASWAGAGAEAPSHASLPRFLASLVGREREVALLRTLLLLPDAPLVTLIGPGGVGKTRLAVRVAEELATAFPDGVAFVPLATIRDPALMLPAIAAVLGVREGKDRPLAGLLSDLLRDRAMVLILDNMEQLPDAGPLVADLLTGSPGLTILATSRSPLRISGERTFDVSPLGLPGPAETNEPPSTAELAGADAVRLFVERGRAVRADFVLTEANAGPVAEICRRLDGLPLAIELAAARVAVLPPPALLARLRRQLPLLTSGARDVPERLRTMRDAIGWSYDLLDEQEQDLFRRLAIFAGGFTLEAAEALVSDDRPPGAQLAVLEGIASLVDKSLLRWEEGIDGEPRYSLLETVREFGRERLAASDDEAAVRERHAAWCLALAKQAEQQLLGPDQRRWTERLEAEHANFREAHAWMTETGAAAAVQLARALWVFWFLRGHLREGLDWLMHALVVAGNAPAADRVQALWGAGMLAWSQGDFHRAEALGTEARLLASEHDFVFGQATALYLLFLATEMQGRRNEALAFGEDSVLRMRASGVRPWLAYVLADVGSRVAEAGDPERGEAWIEEGLALHREFGNKQGLGNKLSDLGLTAHEAGDARAAARHYAESLRHLWEGGDAWYLASPVEGVALIALDTGQPARAAELLGAAKALRERSGGTIWPDERGRIDRATAAAQATLGTETYHQRLAAGRALPLAEAVSTAIVIATEFMATGVPPQPAPNDAFGLSDRELEVLRLLAGGKSNPEIADALFIGRGTVKTHVSNILAKLGAASRTEASAIAHRQGLV